MIYLARAYQKLRKVSDGIERVLKFLTSSLILLCSLSVFLQVINRYILVKQTLFEWKSISWTDELSRLLMVLMAYLAMSMCYKHGQLSRADILYTRLKGKSKKVLYCIETVMIFVFLVAVIVYGIQFASANKIFRSESLRIPGNILYLIPVIGFILMFFQVAVEFIGVISGEVEPFDCIAEEKDAEGAAK